MSTVKVGQIIKGDAERDAIHVAVAPVTAAHMLSPGHHVALNDDGEAVFSDKPIGIVDPFLKRALAVGDRFFLFLYPETVTGMRHHWQHPAFVEQEQDKSGPMVVIEQTAKVCGVSVDRLMDAARQYVEYEDWMHLGENEDYKDVEDWPAFWQAFHELTGLEVAEGAYAPFSCSC